MRVGTLRGAQESERTKLIASGVDWPSIATEKHEIRTQLGILEFRMQRLLKTFFSPNNS
jgi:hypothetical protein